MFHLFLEVYHGLLETVNFQLTFVEVSEQFVLICQLIFESLFKALQFLIEALDLVAEAFDIFV